MSKLDRDGRKERNKAVVQQFKRRGCRLCPERALCCLTAHHLLNDDKLFSIGKCWMTVTTEELIAEIAKCVCLCMNCHKKVHEGILLV